ncbi:transposable element Tcb1 transposase [Trichonephila clavipes]|nr:transposable element Tcb1 transposase [Trichonephila clavipes]
MMEAGWSFKLVARQLGRSDMFVGGVGTSGSERVYLLEDQAQDALDRPVVEKTATSRLAEGHLGSQPPLCVPPLTRNRQRIRLEWCRAVGNWTIAEWNQVFFSDIKKSIFNLSSDDNRVRVWRPRGERLNPAFVYSDTSFPQLL